MKKSKLDELTTALERAGFEVITLDAEIKTMTEEEFAKTGKRYKSNGHVKLHIISKDGDF
jgi:23S rRNA pseudoU1915 N3-methylase RlmH